MRGMDSNQAKIIDLLREVHLIAINEIERLNLRIAELESLSPLPNEAPAKATNSIPAIVPLAAGKPEIMSKRSTIPLVP